MDGKDITGSENILKTWKCHFEKLAIPDEIIYDENDKVKLAEEQNNIIEETILNSSEILNPVTKENVEKAISLLNTGKAPDANGICGEHYKYAKQEL